MMRINVTGIFDGERLTVAWEDGLIDAPEHVTNALCEKAASWVSRTIYLANGERLRGSLFDHPSGFVAVASALLEGATTDWEAPAEPDGVLV